MCLTKASTFRLKEEQEERGSCQPLGTTEKKVKNKYKSTSNSVLYNV